MESTMYLSSYAFVEPEEPQLLYYPSWLNVWESHNYNNALKATAASGWAFKRFGTVSDCYARAAVKKSNYMPYIDAMEHAADAAFHSLSAKERMLLIKSRTAFIYIDSWGESGGFENDVSVLHSSLMDTLPKNIVKKFSINDVTCKIRGEKSALLQAMCVAQDYLSWDIFDFVIICGGYRAIPLLTFSAETLGAKRRRLKRGETPGINITIERVGCFIFSRRESPLKIACGEYVAANRDVQGGADRVACVGRASALALPDSRLDLVDVYGFSGCLTPALSWQYITHHALSGGCLRTLLPVVSGGYHYFDTWY